MRTRASLLITTTLLVISAMSTKAQEYLTIGECVRMAREHYPAIARYGLIEQTARFNLSDASKAWLPQGSAAAQLTWQNDVAALPEALTNMLAQQGVSYPGLDKTQYKVGVDIRQQIWDGGTSAANRRVIRTDADIERNSIDVQIYDVEGRVEELYFSILLLDAQIERAGKSITLIDSTLQQVKSMYANGVAMKSDCDQIEARLLELCQQKSRLLCSRDSCRRVLEIFIGQPTSGRKLILPSEKPADIAGHPLLRLFDSRADNIKAREAGIKASVMPRIGAFASAWYGYPGYDMFRNMQTREPSFNFMGGIKVSWEFGSLYTRKNSLEKLLIQNRQIETERETFLFNNGIAETEMQGRIEGLQDTMRDDVRLVELHRSVVRAARSQLRNGVIDATSLLSKITAEELAENDMSLHRIELTKAKYQLEHIRNK